MSTPVTNESGPSELPRLRIHHLLVLTAIFSVVMTVYLGIWRYYSSSRDMELPDLSGGISILLISQFLSVSVYAATALFGLTWRKHGTAFPSQPGHWMAIYLASAWALEIAYTALVFLPPEELFRSIIGWVIFSIQIVFLCFAIVLWIAAYLNEDSRIWKCGWAVMALKAICTAAWSLFLFFIRFIEWIIEAYWYVDWQFFQSVPIPLGYFERLMFFSSLYVPPLFLSAAIVSDRRNKKVRHWSHWLVIISTLISTTFIIFYYHLAG